MRHIREICETLAKLPNVRMRAKDIEEMFGEPSLEMHRLLGHLVEAIEDLKGSIQETRHSRDAMVDRIEYLDRDRGTLVRQIQSLRRSLEGISQDARDALRGGE